jgi:SWI/SNF-related matrix-associated actin-dependent regulator of chromatin subfamily A3
MAPQTLKTLSSYGVERITGFSGLLPEDKERVRRALKNRSVGPADVTGSASSSKPLPQPSQVTATQQPPPSPRKRKADAMPGPSQTQNVVTPSPTQAAFRQAAIGGAAWEEGADAGEVEDQPVEELYCTVSSNVVGVQYYKGVFLTVYHTRALCHDFAWQASLMLENKSVSSENRTTDMTGKT